VEEVEGEVTKIDYEDVARVLWYARQDFTTESDCRVFELVLEYLVKDFEQRNSRFNREKFLSWVYDDEKP
jgi:hypothetical protein